MSHLYVATNGLSVWHSPDLGETIGRMPSSTGMYSGCQVWSLTTDVSGQRMLLAGTDAGLYRLDAGRQVWRRVPFPMDDVRLITAIAIDPNDRDRWIVGSQPSALFETRDAGATWARLNAPMKQYTEEGFYAGDTAWKDSAPVKHWMRVTQVCFDPRDSATIWAGVEIDAIWKTTNGGRDWRRIDTGLVHQDVHGIGIAYAPRQRLLCTTAGGLHASEDTGETFTPIKLDSPAQYTRSIVERRDRKGVLFATNGNGPPGSWGKLFRSDDHGAHWRQVALPIELESSAYFLAACEAQPDLIALASSLGQLLISRDGGDTWKAVRRRLGEVRALAWLTHEA